MPSLRLYLYIPLVVVGVATMRVGSAIVELADWVCGED
jgi:hypothetical protein